MAGTLQYCGLAGGPVHHPAGSLGRLFAPAARSPPKGWASHAHTSRHRACPGDARVMRTGIVLHLLSRREQIARQIAVAAPGWAAPIELMRTTTGCPNFECIPDSLRAGRLRAASASADS